MLSKPNRKLKKTMKIHKGITIYSFGLPARITCPCAGACKKWCYGKRGKYGCETPKNKRASNLIATVMPTFVDRMNDEISELSAMYKHLYIRIHDTGDFYSIRYFECWLEIARANPDVTFYGYTKCVGMFENMKEQIPANMVFTMSYGGTQDLFMSDDMKQAKVFKKTVPEGWVDGSVDDLTMFTTDRIGLVYH